LNGEVGGVDFADGAVGVLREGEPDGAVDGPDLGEAVVLHHLFQLAVCVRCEVLDNNQSLDASFLLQGGGSRDVAPLVPHDEVPGLLVVEGDDTG